MNIPKVSLTANLQRTKKSGNAPLYIRLSSKTDRPVKIPLGISWPVKKIDGKNNRILPRDPQDPDYNAYQAKIEMETSKYRLIINSLMLLDQPFTSQDIIERVGVYRFKQGFLEYMDHKIKARLRAKQIKYSSSKSHKVTYHHLKAYLNQRDVPVALIDSKWIEKFAKHLSAIVLKTGKHMTANTIWNRIKELKTYVCLAQDDKLEVNPDFRNFENPKVKAYSIYLEEDEFSRLLNFYTDPKTKKCDRNIAAGFIFSCFTGLRISDLQRWNKGWIEGQYFKFIPQKQVIGTQQDELLIPITPMVKIIIDNLEGDAFDLPTDQKVNKGLKRIAKYCAINKRLTSHVARHTCGALLACDGESLLIIGDLLGHKKAETTLTYAHISERAKRRAMMKIDAKFEGWGVNPA